MCIDLALDHYYMLLQTTRPDISNIVKKLSRHMDSAENEHMHAMYRVMQYLLNTGSLGIIYERKNGIALEAYADSDYGSNENCRRSTTEYVIMLGKAAVQWKSKLQNAVSLSSSEAEYKALSACAAELAYVKQI